MLFVPADSDKKLGKGDDARADALIERLVPDTGEFKIHLVGQLVARFALAQNKKPGLFSEAGSQVTMVAGLGYEPRTFRL